MKQELLKALGRCSQIDKDMAERLVGISEKEVESLIEEKLLTRTLIPSDLCVEECYALTEKGEKILKEDNPRFGEVYRGFILEHDLTLMEFYLKRTPEERESWFTRDDLIKSYKLPGTVDGAFLNVNGELEAVEVLSKTAKPSAVEKTEAFLNQAKDIQKMNYLVY